MITTSRWFIAGLSLVALCALVVWITQAARESAPPSGAASLEGVEADEHGGEVELIGSGNAAAADREQRTEPGAADPAYAPGDGELRGTISVRDAADVGHTEESGSFKARVRHAGGILEADVVVERGAWRIKTPRALGLEISEIKLRGRMACATWDEIPVVPDQPVVIESRWPPPSILHVTDRETGRPLLGLLLVMARRYDDWRQNPSEGWEAGIAGRDLESPITLPDRDGVPTWYLRAPGYAWGRLAVDQRTGGEHHMALDPGGDLEVHLSGGAPPENAWLLLKPEGAPQNSRPVAEFKLKGHAPILIEALHPRNYRLEVRRGARGTVVLEARAEVAAGDRRQARLTLPDSGPTHRAPLSGIIRFQEEVAPTGVSIRFMSPDCNAGPQFISLSPSQLTPDPRDPSVLRWNLGKVPPAIWQVHVLPFGTMTSFELGPDGLEHAVVEMPPLCDLEVTISDARDSTSLGDAPYVAVTSTNGELESESELTWHPEKSRWVGRVPRGHVQVWAESPFHRKGVRTVRLQSGVNKLQLDLQPAEVVILRFQDGDAVVPIDRAPSFVFVNEAGETSANRYYDRGEQRLLAYPPGPGRFKLVVEAPEGYEAVPELQLEFASGQQLERTIQLKRSP